MATDLCKFNAHDLTISKTQGDTMIYKCKNCNYELTLIPKECIVCDGCNAGMSDENFVAVGDCYWFEDFLYCKGCFEKCNRDLIDLKMKILVGDELANTELALPIHMEFF